MFKVYMFSLFICICVLSSVHCHGMILNNPITVINDDYVLDIDTDCDYDPDRDEVYNCKIITKSDE